MKNIFRKKVITLFAFAVPLILNSTSILFSQSLENENNYNFDITCDMRYFAGPEYQTSQYFMGVCEAINDIGKGVFMISPGDIDPPWEVSKTISEVLGEDYFWYPVVGNHETETPVDMDWLRNWGKKDILNLVSRGPENCKETTYSFEYKNTHFAVLNVYFDNVSDVGSDGDIGDSLYFWLKNDLENNTKPVVFVIGHEPLVSMPDIDNGRHRHRSDNLDKYPENNHRFQMLLRKHKVAAYICGHTHNFSHAKINGIWQIDTGHSRGIGDSGARSTFLKINVSGNQCYIDVYRSDAECNNYLLAHTINLD